MKKGQEQGINLLFREHFASLCLVSVRIVQDQETAKDIVQDVFVKVWTHRKKLHIHSSLFAYLKKSVVHASIDHQRQYYEKNKVSLEELEEPNSTTQQVEANLVGQETQALIDAAVASLSERCRLVFVLSRYESYSYKQIAKELDISVKTVESQMTKALRLLRDKLGPL